MHDLESLLADDDELLLLEPRTIFDRAIMGLAERADGLSVIAYDSEKCVQALISEHGWSREEAQEWFDFNTAGAWVGERTPLFVSLLDSIQA